MLAKIAVLVLSALGIGSLLFDYPGVWTTASRGIFGFLFVSHIAETFFFYKRMKERPEPLMPNIISSLVFGIVHNRRYLK